MAQFKVKVDQPRWLQMIRDKQRPVATAAVAALRETASEAVTEGRSDIASAGKFGTRWQQGLQFRMENDEAGGEPSLQATATVFHKRGLAFTFEKGATIRGQPLLWIGLQSRRGKRVVSATVRGQPMLFDANDRSRHRGPLAIGVPSITIPKKFHITEIVKDHASRIAELFLKFFKDN